MARFSLAGILLISLLIGGCAVASRPRIATVQAASSLPGTVAFASAGPEGEASPDLVRLFEGYMRSNLTQRGVTLASDADSEISIALSQHSANSRPVILSGSADQAFPPRRHHLFDGCKAQRLEAVALVIKRSSGESDGRWRGVIDACKPAEPQIAALAAALAQAITAR